MREFSPPAKRNGNLTLSPHLGVAACPITGAPYNPQCAPASYFDRFLRVSGFNYLWPQVHCNAGSAWHDWRPNVLVGPQLWRLRVASGPLRPCQNTSRRVSGLETRHVAVRYCAAERRIQPVSAPSPGCRVCSGTAIGV